MKKSFLLLSLLCFTQGIFAETVKAPKKVFFDITQENPKNPYDAPGLLSISIECFCFEEGTIDDDHITQEEQKKLAQVFNAIERYSALVDDISLQRFFEQQRRVLEGVRPFVGCAYAVGFVYVMYLDINRLKDERFDDKDVKKFLKSLVCFFESLFNKATEKYDFVITGENKNTFIDVSYEDAQKMLQELKEALA